MYSVDLLALLITLIFQPLIALLNLWHTSRRDDSSRRLPWHTSRHDGPSRPV